MKLQCPSLNDLELIQHLQMDERYALDEIYQRHAGFLFQYAYKRLGDKDDVQDLVQDLFLKLWIKRSSIHIKGSLRAYLTFCLRNSIIDKYQHQITRNNYFDSIKHSIEDECNVTQQLIDYKGLQQFLDFQVNKLPTKMQEIFVLRKVENLTIDEISAKLSLSKQTVKNQLHSALNRLKICFECYFSFILYPALHFYLLY